MTALRTMLRWDYQLLLRSHFVVATVLTTAFLCGAAALIPVDPLPAKLVATLIFLDPAVIGMTFVGAFVLLEKGAHTLSALGVSPLRARDYVASKIIAFSSLGAVGGLIVALVARGLALNIPLLLAMLLLSNVVAVEIGFLLVARSRSVNGFLRNSIIASFALAAPLAGFWGAAPPLVDLALMAVPSYAMLVAFEAGVSGPSVAAAVSAVYLAALAVVLWCMCLRDYEGRLVRSGL
ncbi:MAG: hypothetical protein AAGJ87_05865 [Pseudomonadota bacterium]